MTTVAVALDRNLFSAYYSSINAVCCLYLASLSNLSVNHFCVFVNCDVSLIK